MAEVAPAAGGYGNTNEGKIIAAAFMDNYNNIVGVVRGDPSLQRNVGTLKEEAAAGGKTKAGAVFNEGDVLAPKIAGIKLLAEPSDSAKALATLGKSRRARRDRRGEGWLHRRAGCVGERLGEDRARPETVIRALTRESRSSLSP